MNHNRTKEPVIIPIASGKGGVGKSLFTAQVSQSIAGIGYRTLAIDLDLGCSNLHLYFGLANEHAGVGDYLLKKGAELKDFAVQTSTPNLKFIAGDGLSPFLANIGYAQKARLLRAIRKLPYDYIIMDLGAGTTYNTLDFFSTAPNGVIITVPEYSSIMNLMVFFKALALRTLTREVGNKHNLKKIVDDARKQTVKDNAKTISTIVNEVGGVCSETASRVTQRLSNIRPRIAINMVREPEDLDFIFTVRDSLQRRTSLAVDYVGSVIEDSSISASRQWSRPSSAISMKGFVGNDIEQIARRLIYSDGVQEEQAFEQTLEKCRSRFDKS